MNIKKMKMQWKNRQFLYSTATLIGTTVGIGIFGIPFAFIKSGFLTGIFFLILLGAINLILNLAFGEMTLRTEGFHQLAGYTEVYLGNVWKKIVLFSLSLGIYAAILAYVIISGEFLTNIVSISSVSLSPFTLSTLFFIIVSLLILGGLKTISRFEFFMSGALMAIIAILVFFSLPKIDLSPIPLIRKEFFFLSYGILLFALQGSSAIPLQREILEGKEEYLKKSICWGSLIPAIVYLLFALIVGGVSGEGTSPDAVSGLHSYLGFSVVFLLSLFGTFAVATSFLSLGMSLFEVFHYDFRVSKISSWLLVIIPPYFLFLSGTRNFIDVINLGGAVAVGIISIIFILLYQKIKSKGQRIPEYSLNIPKWIWYTMIGLFSFGIIYTLIF